MGRPPQENFALLKLNWETVLMETYEAVKPFTPLD